MIAYDLETRDLIRTTVLKAEFLEFEAVLSESRRWRDGRAVVHALVPTVSVSVWNGERKIVDWQPACGHRRKNTKEHDPALMLTCLTCIAKETP